MVGEAGSLKQHEIIERLRSGRKQWTTKFEIIDFLDYSQGLNGLPASNLIKIVFKDNSWLALRPSGTEEKLKVYLEAIGDSRVKAEARLEQLKRMAGRLVDPL